jgi:Na+/glutamate symporter
MHQFDIGALFENFSVDIAVYNSESKKGNQYHLVSLLHQVAIPNHEFSIVAGVIGTNYLYFLGCPESYFIPNKESSPVAGVGVSSYFCNLSLKGTAEPSEPEL